jgi:hypothetical protein
MPGTSPGMTSLARKPQFYWLHFESDSQDEGGAKTRFQNPHGEEHVGWVERTGRANARPMINSAISINCSLRR